MSYRWQVKKNFLWRDLLFNQEVERAYCNPANTKLTGRLPVNFETMMCDWMRLRRTCQGDTKWVWYWEEAEGKWREYENSEVLEKHYLSGNRRLTFTVGIHQYELKMSAMVQKNIKTKMERRVRRRPVFQNAVERFSSNGIPIYWDPKRLPSVGFERVTLERSSPEYSTVLSLFRRTMPGWNITGISRIQNLPLWNFFKLQRDAMKAKAGQDVDERLLFHGTEAQNVDAICQDNVDWRLCGQNGIVYGEGSYFARDAVYSNRYTNNQGAKSIFVCRVLVGDFTKGKRTYKKPPLKDEQQRIAFDSCVNDLDDPSIFVIFEKNQIYPEYLIQYEVANGATVTQPSQTTRGQSDEMHCHHWVICVCCFPLFCLPMTIYGVYLLVRWRATHYDDEDDGQDPPLTSFTTIQNG